MAKTAESLQEVMKSIQKKFGDNVIRVGAQDLTVDGTLSLGSPSLDFCIYGGIPEGRIVEFSGAEGSGKAQPLWSPVFTPYGYKKMGDINVGDTLIDGKGNFTQVIGVYPRGKLRTYKVSFNDGTSTYCAEDHLWKVYNHSYGNPAKTEVISTLELIHRNLHAGCWGYSVDVPKIDCWEDDNINIDPYLLGALIGDGSLCNNFSFSNSEMDVVSKVNEKLQLYNYELVPISGFDYGITKIKECKQKYMYILDGQHHSSVDEVVRILRDEGFRGIAGLIVSYKKGNNDLYKRYPELMNRLIIERNKLFFNRNDEGTLYSMLKDYGILRKSIDKHIPENYLYSSYATRVALLQGLYDTDGYTDVTGKMSISTSSEKLADDISFLLRSLGCRVSVKYSSTSSYTYKGELREGHPSWSIHIKCPEGLVIGTSNKHLERLKINNHKPASSKWWRSIVSIEYVGEEECQCIMVDSSEHTYLTDDLICTHNTTNAFLAAASYQREELKRNPDNPRAIVFLDNEGTADAIWAEKMGYNMAEDAAVPTILIRPEAQSAEEIFDMALDMLKTGEVGLLIFDSLATLVPAQIADESMEKYQMGGIAKSLTRFANTAIGLLRKYKATLIAINQVRENLTGYGDHLQTPGGRAWKHACSMRLMFKRGAFFDEDGNELTKSAQSPAGHIIEMTVLKTKTCKWDRKLGTAHLNYVKGIDTIQDTIDTALHLGFIDNSVQGTFKLLDPDTGMPMLDAEGNEIKIRGKKNVATYFREHLDDWRKLYDLVYDKLCQKEDANIKSFEEMLGISVFDKLGVEESTNLEEI